MLEGCLENLASPSLDKRLDGLKYLREMIQVVEVHNNDEEFLDIKDLSEWILSTDLIKKHLLAVEDHSEEPFVQTHITIVCRVREVLTFLHKRGKLSKDILDLLFRQVEQRNDNEQVQVIETVEGLLQYLDNEKFLYCFDFLKKFENEPKFAQAYRSVVYTYSMDLIKRKKAVEEEDVKDSAEEIRKADYGLLLLWNSVKNSKSPKEIRLALKRITGLIQLIPNSGEILRKTFTSIEKYCLEHPIDQEILNYYTQYFVSIQREEKNYAKGIYEAKFVESYFEKSFLHFNELSEDEKSFDKLHNAIIMFEKLFFDPLLRQAKQSSKKFSPLVSFPEGMTDYEDVVGITVTAVSHGKIRLILSPKRTLNELLIMMGYKLRCEPALLRLLISGKEIRATADLINPISEYAIDDMLTCSVVKRRGRAGQNALEKAEKEGRLIGGLSKLDSLVVESGLIQDGQLEENELSFNLNFPKEVEEKSTVIPASSVESFFRLINKPSLLSRPIIILKIWDLIQHIAKSSTEIGQGSDHELKIWFVGLKYRKEVEKILESMSSEEKELEEFRPYKANETFYQDVSIPLSKQEWRELLPTNKSIFELYLSMTLVKKYLTVTKFGTYGVQDEEKKDFFNEGILKKRWSQRFILLGGLHHLFDVLHTFQFHMSEHNLIQTMGIKTLTLIVEVIQFFFYAIFSHGKVWRHAIPPQLTKPRILKSYEKMIPEQYIKFFIKNSEISPEHMYVRFLEKIIEVSKWAPKSTSTQLHSEQTLMTPIKLEASTTSRVCDSYLPSVDYYPIEKESHELHRCLEVKGNFSTGSVSSLPYDTPFGFLVDSMFNFICHAMVFYNTKYSHFLSNALYNHFVVDKNSRYALPTPYPGLKIDEEVENPPPLQPHTYFHCLCVHSLFSRDKSIRQHSARYLHLMFVKFPTSFIVHKPYNHKAMTEEEISAYSYDPYRGATLISSFLSISMYIIDLLHDERRRLAVRTTRDPSSELPPPLNDGIDHGFIESRFLPVCGELFDLTCRSYDESGLRNLPYTELSRNRWIEASGHLQKHIRLLRGLCSIESGRTGIRDELLGGSISLIMSLVRAVRHLKQTTPKIFVPLISELTTSCLYLNPDCNIDTKLAFPKLYPKCRSELSRRVAYRLLAELSFESHDLWAEIFKTHSHRLIQDRSEEDILNKSHIQNLSRVGFGYDSLFDEQSITQYVGLKNPACICYLNSTLQQLYMIPEVRKGILSVDLGEQTEEDKLARSGEYADKYVDDNKNVVSSLQEMFATLVFSTKKNFLSDALTRSYKDWDGNEINIRIQQDASEFVNGLADKIDFGLSGTSHEKLMTSTFGGHIAYRTECLTCGYQSERKEPIMTLGVDPGNQGGSVENSLRKLVAGEKMAGNNKYNCPKCLVKVDAIRRSMIKDLSDHLIISLNRFGMNYDLRQRYKINNACEFPVDLDLSNYTCNYFDGERDIKGFKYTLTGIVVHQGTADSGHYYSYIKEQCTNTPHCAPVKKSRWLKFNDSIVTEWDPKNLADECFGGKKIEMVWTEDMTQELPRELWKTNNAYLLFYTRVKEVEDEKVEVEEKEAKEDKRLFAPKGFEHLETVCQNIYYSNRQYLDVANTFEISYFNYLWNFLKQQEVVEKTMRNHYYSDPLYTMYSNKPIDLMSSAMFDVISHAYNNNSLLLTWKTFMTSFLTGERGSKVNSKRYCRFLFKKITNYRNGTWPWEFLLVCDYDHVRDIFLEVLMTCLKGIVDECRDTYFVEVEDEYQGETFKREINNSENIVVKFIDSLLNYFPRITAFWRSFSHYFHFFNEFAGLGWQETQLLMNAHVVEEFICFYSSQPSPYLWIEAKEQKDLEEQMRMGSKRTNPDVSGLVGCLDTIVDNIVRFPEIMQKQSRDTGARKIEPGTHSFFTADSVNPPNLRPYPLEPVDSKEEVQEHFLEELYSEKSRNNFTYPIYYDNFTKYNFFDKFFENICKEDQHPAAVSRICKRLCFENYELSQICLRACESGLDTYNEDHYYTFCLVIKSVLEIKDRYAKSRVDYAMKFLIAAVYDNNQYETCCNAGIKMLWGLIDSKSIYANPYIQTWMIQNIHEHVWIDSYQPFSFDKIQ